MKNSVLGKAGAAITGLAVLAFAVFLAVGLSIDTLFACCLSSMFIALSFVPFMAALNAERQPEHQACGTAGMCFAAVYAVIVCLVYYAECTTVRMEDGLSEEALSIISFGRQGSLFFNYDLLGYGFMALSTFLTGLALDPSDGNGRWLKRLLIGHGVFFPACFLVPMFPVFSADTESMVGAILLLIWCAYFLPICILGFRHFAKE